MKVTDQNIPPDIMAAYRKLVAQGFIIDGLQLNIRSKKNIYSINKPKKKRKELRDIEQAVDFLIDYLTIKNIQSPPPSFRKEQIDKLKKGIFDTNYWKKCTQDSVATFSNTPATNPWVGGRRYSYPDPDNQPTVAVYGEGVVSDGNGAYSGATVGGYFHDLFLKWKRYVFTLNNSFTTKEKEPLYLKITGHITASATLRPSRAMISTIVKRWITTTASARKNTLESPTLKPLNFFFRYKTPHGDAPYFGYTHPVQIVKNIRALKTYEEAGTLGKCVILISPMPMMGKRYNNNESVTTILDSVIELWQIKKIPPGFYVNSLVFDALGGFTRIDDLNEVWYVYHDDQHGLMEHQPDIDGIRRWSLLDGRYNKTNWIPPWESLPGWNAASYIVTANRHPQGYLICCANMAPSPIHYYVITPDGLVMATYTDATAPFMNQIAAVYRYEHPLIDSISQYAFNDAPVSGESTLSLYDLMGVKTQTINYGGAAPWLSNPAITDRINVFTTTWELKDTGFWFQIWQINISPAVLFIEVEIGDDYRAGVNFHAETWFVWPYDQTKKTMQISMLGQITYLEKSGGLEAWSTNPNRHYWVGN